MQWKDWVHATHVELGRERNRGNERWSGREDITFAMRESGKGGESISDKVTERRAPRNPLVGFQYEQAGGTRVSVERGASGITVSRAPRVGETGAWGPEEGRRREGRRREREGEERRREERDEKTWELWR